MDRKAGRALAKSTLEDLAIFDKVLEYEPDAYATLPPPSNIIATVHSKSLSYVEDARESFESLAEVWVSIYLRRPKGQGQATEDALDDLVRASMRALAEAFSPYAAQLQIGPSQAGYPPIDGKSYRIERFAVRFNDDEE